MAAATLAPTRGVTLGTVFGHGRFQAGTPIATGATVTQDIDVSDYDLLTLIVDQSGAAAGDITVTVTPYEADLATASFAPIPITAGAATLSGGHVEQAIQVNVTGLKAVRVAVKNNNAGAQTIAFIDAFAGVTGTDF